MTKCSHCGAEAPSGSNFCPKCGAPLEAPAAPNDPSLRPVAANEKEIFEDRRGQTPPRGPLFGREPLRPAPYEAGRSAFGRGPARASGTYLWLFCAAPVIVFLIAYATSSLLVTDLASFVSTITFLLYLFTAYMDNREVRFSGGPATSSLWALFPPLYLILRLKRTKTGYWMLLWFVVFALAAGFLYEEYFYGMLLGSGFI